MNFVKLAEDLGLEEEEYLELIELFLESGTSDLNQLQAAIEEGDAEKAARAAHSLKGASGNLGLMELHELAKTIEAGVRNNRLKGMAEPVQVLEKKLGVIAELARG